MERHDLFTFMSRVERTGRRVFVALMLLMAIIFASLAVWFCVSAIQFQARAIGITGVVTGLRPSTDHKSTTYATQFEFTDANGTKHQSVTKWSSNPPAHTIGDPVQVLYPPGNPASAQLGGFAGLWAKPVIFAVMSITPLLMGVVLLWLVPLIQRWAWTTAIQSLLEFPEVARLVGQRDRK